MHTLFETTTACPGSPAIFPEHVCLGIKTRNDRSNSKMGENDQNKNGEKFQSLLFVAVTLFSGLDRTFLGSPSLALSSGHNPGVLGTVLPLDFLDFKYFSGRHSFCATCSLHVSCHCFLSLSPLALLTARSAWILYG